MSTKPTYSHTAGPGTECPLASGNLLAVFHVQHPLTGDADPVVRVINERTTVAELMDWHRRNCEQPQNWKPNCFNVRLITSSR